jgi:protein-disulfide isomerase
MTRLFTCLFLIFAAPAAFAFDVENMTDQERAAFRNEIRDYLLQNPDILMEAFAVLEDRQLAQDAAAAQQAVADNTDAIFNSDLDWVGGNPDGDIIMVEFLDYQCGFCRRAHPEVNALLQQDGNIRLVVKEFPILGEASVTASRFAIATRLAFGDDAYGHVNDALMTLRGDINETTLARIADDADLDADTIFATMDDPRVDETINTNYALAQSLGISGTPSFVFRDRIIPGYLPASDLLRIVEDIRENAG